MNFAYILKAAAVAALAGVVLKPMPSASLPSGNPTSVASFPGWGSGAGFPGSPERTLLSLSSSALPIDTAKNITVLIQGVKPGSGAIVGKRGNTYYVLTAKHVVRRHSEYDIFTPSGEKHRIKTEEYPDRVTLFPGVDLAVVSFQSDRDYQVATLADYNAASEEQFVFVYGWPTSTATVPEREASFQKGTLMQKEIAPLFLRRDFSSKGYELVYTNMTRKGMSGGPVLDSGGRLIGIHGIAEAYTHKVVTAEVDGVSIVQPQEIFLGYSFGMPIKKFLNHPSASMVPSLKVEQSAASEVPEEDIRRVALEMLRNGEFLPVDSSGNETPESLTNQANRMLRFLNLPKAIEGFENALRYDDRFYRAWYGKGIVLTYWKKYDEAIAAFERALEINSEFEQARELIANIRQATN